MTDVTLCPRCFGQKTVCELLYGAESCTPMYKCPLCEGRGYIQVDDVSRDKLDTMHHLVLLSMETSEHLMDECVERADKIEELESEVERLNMKIFNIEGREEICCIEMKHRAEVAEKQRDDLSRQYDAIRKYYDMREDDLTELNAALRRGNVTLRDRLSFAAK